MGHGNNANIILEQLKKHKVDFLGVQSKSHTGYSIILETDKKNRTVLTYKGASNELHFGEIRGHLNTGWVHFTSLAGESFKTQKKIMSYCKKNGIRTSFNPSIYQTRLGLRKIGEMIRNADVVSMNREEARMLVKGDLAKKLFALGPGIVVLTSGGEAGEVYDGKFRYKFYPNKVKIWEKTGAGDVFSSSFVAGLIKGKDVETSIKIAMANSESHISTRGAKAGLLSFSEVRGKIKKGKYRVEREGI
jgi:sugar/nucleoside kinase (ribokinase family)